MTSREDVVYQAVAARRVQFDNLVWQVPALSLTAQAFLFTIALGGTSSPAARIIASLLSLLVTFLCITLMTRHRQSEIYDANWLENYEGRFGAEQKTDDGVSLIVHGQIYRAGRNKGPVDGGWTERVPFVRPYPGYKTWVGGLLGFGLVAVVVLAITLCSAETFATPQRPSTTSTPIPSPSPSPTPSPNPPAPTTAPAPNPPPAPTP